MSRRLIRRAAALVASLSLPFALAVPLHTHTCHWPSAASGATAFDTPSNEAQSATEYGGACLACTINRRLQAPVTAGPVALPALPATAGAVLTPFPGRPVCGALRLAPPRGPPLSS